MSTIDEIKSRLDLVDLVSEAGVRLRKTGRNYTGFCPFHDNKHTPAFVVWPETGTWRCFGQCNEGGDMFKFVMKREGLDFKEALQKLADRAGVQVESYQRETPAQKEAYDHLRKLLEDALVFYRSQLFNNTGLLSYLHEKRGLTDAAIETFGLGYAPDAWDAALKHFTSKGYSQQDLIDAGLLTVREPDTRHPSPVTRPPSPATRHPSPDTRVYDRFRHRLMIPIRDENGRMAGFGARIVNPDDIPKFLNSPETPVFTKGRLLYGLDRARKPIRTADQAVIVEGYLDVIALHQAGYENVVSPMGTALTEEQLRLLKKFSRRIVLALDPDAAGQKAVLRGLEAARQAMDREGELGFDARGLLKNEARLQADLRVASMPEGLDPDEIVARDPAEWKVLIESAKPIVTHVMEALAAGRDLKDAKVRNDIAVQVLPLISDLPNAAERDTFRQQLERMLGLREGTLLGTQAAGPRARRPRAVPQKEQVAGTPVVVTGRPTRRIESHCLGVLFRRPDLLYRLDRQLEQAGLSPLASEDFEYTDHQMLFRLIRQSVEQDETDHHQFVTVHVPEALSGLARELITQTEKLERVEDRLLDDLKGRLVDLRRTMASVRLNELSFQQEEDQTQGGSNTRFYQDQVSQIMELIKTLDQARKSFSHHK